MTKEPTAIEEVVQDLGKMLGDAQRKAEDWMANRQSVAKELSDIRDTAARLISQLVGNGAAATKAARRGRPAGSRNRATATVAEPGRPSRLKKRTMSAEGKASIAAAQKARWAKVRAGKKK